MHVGFGLTAFLAIGAGMAVRAFFIGEGGLLLQQVVGDVDCLDGDLALGNGRVDVVAEVVVTVGDDPPLCPVGGCGCADELIDFSLVDGATSAIRVQLAGLALNGDKLVIAADPNNIDSHILAVGSGIEPFPLRPLRPGVATGDVPLLDVGANLNGKVFKPDSIRLLWAHLVDNTYGLCDKFLCLGAGHRGITRKFGSGLWPNCTQAHSGREPSPWSELIRCSCALVCWGLAVDW
ncbi:MAG: hypothetical protein OXF67_06560 [Cyanobacteria bacterium MAG CAR4_bin_6]|nr:hypothetical protein [Cyanobacteria bacterium MAG CAR4_bin_6]